MLYNKFLLNIERLDLNFCGIVVSLADGVATVAGLQDVLVDGLVLFGEVQGLVLALIRKLEKFFFAVKKCTIGCMFLMCSLSNNQVNNLLPNRLDWVKDVNDTLYVIVLLFACSLLISIILSVVDSWNSKTYVVCSNYLFLFLPVLTSTLFLFNLKNIFLLRLDVSSLTPLDLINNNISNIVILTIITLPFIFFVLTILMVINVLKSCLNETLGLNSTLYVVFWTFLALGFPFLGLFNLIFLFDAVMFDDLISIFLIKSHSRVFIMSFSFPIITFILIFILKILKRFNINKHDAMLFFVNTMVERAALQKWYWKLFNVFFVALLYTLVSVYGPLFVKPFNLIYLYRNLLAFLSTIFLFPILNIGRFVMGGAFMYKPSGISILKDASKQIIETPVINEEVAVSHEKVDIFVKDVDTLTSALSKTDSTSSTVDTKLSETQPNCYASQVKRC